MKVTALKFPGAAQGARGQIRGVGRADEAWTSATRMGSRSPPPAEIGMTPQSPHLIRVLVVDDSFFMRKILVKMLDDPKHGITVVDTAKTGLEAIEKNKLLKPDVITLDVEMPHMDGLSALRRIIVEDPVPVIMLSAHTGKGTETTIKALEIGAVDCFGKPSGIPITDLESIKSELIEKVKAASVTHPRKRSEAELNPSEKPPARLKRHRFGGGRGSRAYFGGGGFLDGRAAGIAGTSFENPSRVSSGDGHCAAHLDGFYESFSQAFG